MTREQGCESSRPRSVRLLFGVLAASWLVFGSSAACGPVIRPVCAPGELCASMVLGVMGGGDSTCALDSSRRFLTVKVVTDCPTTAPLVLTVHDADPYDTSFQPVREERTETLSPHVVLSLTTTKVLPLTPGIKQLRLQVEATCKEGDQIVMRHGDARCDVPAAPGAR